MKERVPVNVKITMDDYNRFTFTESLKRIEETATEKPKLVVPYAFPSSTSPNCHFQWQDV